MPNIVSKLKARVGEISAKTLEQVKSGGKDLALANVADSIKIIQMECMAKGKPLTEEEVVDGLTYEWNKTMHKVYEGLGLTLDEVTEAGKQALNDSFGVLLPKPKGFGIIHSLVKRYGRNEPCPCGSNKKYKKCCGRNG